MTDSFLSPLARSRRYEQLCSRLVYELDGGDARPLDEHLDMNEFDVERDDQRVAIAVCRAAGTTPERWDRLNPFAREPYVELALAEFAIPPNAGDESSPADGPSPDDTTTTAEQKTADTAVVTGQVLTQLSHPEPTVYDPNVLRGPDGEAVHLSPDEYIVLRMLRNAGVHILDISGISIASRVAKSSVAEKTCGEVVKSLIGRGLAERPGDRKRGGIKITPLGRKALDRADATAPVGKRPVNAR